jgi:chemotaxis protein methyltransferase CheR
MYHRNFLVCQVKEQLEAERAYLKEEIKLEYNHHNIVGKSVGLKYVKLNKLLPAIQS